MQCSQCQFDNRQGVRFCEECGTILDQVCPACGAVIPAERKFCGMCGHTLTATSRPAPTPMPLSAPSAAAAPGRVPLAHTPAHLAEKILTARTALEGERKQVTVLFADIKDSTELIKDLDPEAAQQLLDPALHLMMDAVHRYEGTVNQVLGDGIMALFGAPLAHEDHAMLACYAALTMQTAMQAYTAEVRRTYGLEMRLRVGLNSGEVVVRTISNDLHMDYSAVGQTTHLAARMEQVAAPGTIRLPASTLRFVEGLVRVNALGAIPLKGMPEPVEVFELLGVTTIRRRLQATAAQGLSRFVGRQTELTALRQALEQAQAGHGQVVALVGEAGVGKSRLVYECVHAHHTQDWYVLESTSASYGKATAYFPVIDLLKRYCQIDDGDETRAIRAKVTGRILTLDETLRETVPPLLFLLEALPEDSPFLSVDPSQRRQRLLEALKRVLLRESQVQPLLLVFEDLHWIDSETQALLDSLVESLPTAQVLLLVNYRPEYSHLWGNKTYYTQLRLDPLPPESAEVFLQGLLGDDPGLEPLKRLLIERTAGNPFFLEESVRTLVETQVLVGEPGAYRLAQAVPTIQVPATVQAILAARIDRLPAEDKRLLQTAAVIGTDVPLPLLQAIAELPEAALYRSLTHLQAAEFLYETRLFPDREYTFKHALTHEVAYGSLLQERRRVLHARVVEALEQLHPDRVIEQVDRLAYHALRGEMWDKALVYFRQAGTRAVQHSAHREALACFDQALTALSHLPEIRATMEQAIDLRFERRPAFVSLGEFDRLLDDLRAAENLAEALDDEHRLGWVSSFMAHYYWRSGDSPLAVTIGQRALSLARSWGDVPLQIATETILSRAHWTLGDYAQTIDLAKQLRLATEGDLRYERFGLNSLPSVLSRVFLAWCLGEQGAFAEGIAYGEEGLRIAEEADHPDSFVRISQAIGHLYLCKGEIQRALPILERGLAVCQEANIPVMFPWLAAELGYAYAFSGRVPEAIPLVEQAVQRSRAMKSMSFLSLWVGRLSTVYRLAGRSDAASRHAEQALALARAHQDRGHEAWSLWLLGDSTIDRDPEAAERAAAYHRQALALAEELGMRPLQAHCHHGLGRLYSQIGRAEQARAALSIAIDLYRTMAMTFWMPQAEAILAQILGAEEG